MNSIHNATARVDVFAVPVKMPPHRAVDSWNDGQRHGRKNDKLLRDAAEQNSRDAPGAAFAYDDGVRLLFLRDLDDRLRGFAGPRFKQNCADTGFSRAISCRRQCLSRLRTPIALSARCSGHG